MSTGWKLKNFTFIPPCKQSDMSMELNRILLFKSRNFSSFTSTPPCKQGDISVELNQNLPSTGRFHPTFNSVPPCKQGDSSYWIEEISVHRLESFQLWLCIILQAVWHIISIRSNPSVFRLVSFRLKHCIFLQADEYIAKIRLKPLSTAWNLSCICSAPTCKQVNTLLVPDRILLSTSWFPSNIKLEPSCKQVGASVVSDWNLCPQAGIFPTPLQHLLQAESPDLMPDRNLYLQTKTALPTFKLFPASKVESLISRLIHLCVHSGISPTVLPSPLASKLTLWHWEFDPFSICRSESCYQQANITLQAG